MGIVYPGSVDVFTVPSNPAGTPLSEAGDGTRNSPETARDLGAAVTALQVNAAKKGHDHSGDGSSTATGSKLNQANTHQNPDTDAAPTSIHHTLGPGANQAAPGNHSHDYSDVPNTPYRICTSFNRPSSPFEGLMIFETDTNFMRVWTDLGTENYSWRILPSAMVPSVRLQQGQTQQLNYGGTILNWHTVLDDTNSFFNSGVSLTDIKIREPGLYRVSIAMQWSSTWCPDISAVVMTVNGSETNIRDQKFQRGEDYIPGFSQTLSASSDYRFGANDTVRFKATYQGSSNILTRIETFFLQLTGQGYDANSYITSHCELSYISP